MYENIKEIIGFLSNLGIFFLVWNTIRNFFLSAEFDEKKLKVPKDEIKEAFRRATLAEISRLNGGKRVDLEAEWKKNKLIVKTK